MDFLIYLCRGRLTNKEMPVAFLCLKMVGEGEERENAADPGPEEKAGHPAPSGRTGKAGRPPPADHLRNRHLQAGGALPPAGRRNGTERLRRGKAPGAVSGKAGGRGPAGAGNGPLGGAFSAD